MPLNRNNRVNKVVEAAEHYHQQDRQHQQHHHHAGRQHEGDENRDPNLVSCCVPSGCPDGPINPSDPEDAVKVACNNEQCTIGVWMHKACFQEWEQSVLAYLRSCGRARSWSEKQRLQNLWTKKGYDLAFKACDCKCGRGHLRKDLDYFPKAKPAMEQPGKKKRSNKKKNDKPMPVMHKGPQTHVRPQLRVRTSSIGSAGSSPPNSASSGGSPPSTPGTPVVVAAIPKKSKFDFFADPAQAAAGNIFRRRTDLSAFNHLPRHKQNPYHIKMEDEGPHGNDDTRCFILSNLSTYKATEIPCVLCNKALTVYDKYPLIDGTFFLSPMRYNSPIKVTFDGKQQYMNAICMHCLEGGTDIRCYNCKRRWDGSTLLLGTMYSYDIFAAMPCCQRRLTCKSCHRNVLEGCGFQFYSEYSHSLQCPFCRMDDYHFVKPLTEIYYLKQPICKYY